VHTLTLNWLGYDGVNGKISWRIPFEELSSSDTHTSIMKEMKDIAANNIERAKFLARFQESDHEAIDQERKRYSRVLSQRRGIASRVRGIRASLRNTETRNIITRR
jgi:hypothetical protein